jgi:tellurite methyltransferase
MSGDDASRWDQRYTQDERFATFTEPRAFLIEQSAWLPQNGLALDIAMGLGGNAAFLLERGLQVIGVDISWVALQQVKARLPGLMVIQADLPSIHLPPGIFDVIINFYFLRRELWSEFQRWLKPGGVLIFETLTRDMLNIQPGIDPLFLLEAGELWSAFQDWEIIFYREGRILSRRGHPSAVASLVARSGLL